VMKYDDSMKMNAFLKVILYSLAVLVTFSIMLFMAHSESTRLTRDLSSASFLTIDEMDNCEDSFSGIEMENCFGQ
jgi:hypothetical protein